jgi:hypothetical protein
VTQIIDGTVAGQRHLGLPDQDGDGRAQLVRDIRIERLEPPVSAVKTLKRPVE